MGSMNSIRKEKARRIEVLRENVNNGWKLSL
jgi:hypothetical protein